jgi:hypothetical protein
MLPRISTPVGPPACKAAKPEKEAFKGERKVQGDFIILSPEVSSIGRVFGRSTVEIDVVFEVNDVGVSLVAQSEDICESEAVVDESDE